MDRLDVIDSDAAAAAAPAPGSDGGDQPEVTQPSPTSQELCGWPRTTGGHTRIRQILPYLFAYCGIPQRFPQIAGQTAETAQPDLIARTTVVLAIKFPECGSHCFAGVEGINPLYPYAPELEALVALQESVP